MSLIPASSTNPSPVTEECLETVMLDLKTVLRSPVLGAAERRSQRISATDLVLGLSSRGSGDSAETFSDL